MDSLIIAMVIGIVIVGIGLLVVIAVSKRGVKPLNKEQYQTSWITIEKSVINTDDPAKLQMAILYADKLLDKALKELRYKGESMGERMASASRVFTRREAVWAAHKLRNRIAHEEKVKINPQLTKKALASFKKALQDLGAI